jgi:hypothetical protein
VLRPKHEDAFPTKQTRTYLWALLLPTPTVCGTLLPSMQELPLLVRFPRPTCLTRRHTVGVQLVFVLGGAWLCQLPSIQRREDQKSAFNSLQILLCTSRSEDRASALRKKLVCG